MNNISFGAKIFLDAPGAKNSYIKFDTDDVYLKANSFNNTSTQVVNKYTDTNLVMLLTSVDKVSKIFDSLKDGDTLETDMNGRPKRIVSESGEIKELDVYA